MLAILVSLIIVMKLFPCNERLSMANTGLWPFKVAFLPVACLQYLTPITINIDPGLVLKLPSHEAKKRHG